VTKHGVYDRWLDTVSMAGN